MAILKDFYHYGLQVWEVSGDRFAVALYREEATDALRDYLMERLYEVDSEYLMNFVTAAENLSQVGKEAIFKSLQALYLEATNGNQDAQNDLWELVSENQEDLIRSVKYDYGIGYFLAKDREEAYYSRDLPQELVDAIADENCFDSEDEKLDIIAFVL